MANLESLILRGTRGSQPSAGIPGRIYFVTDESKLERDNGTLWQDISASATGSSGVNGIPTNGWIDSTSETWSYVTGSYYGFTGSYAGIFNVNADVTTKYAPAQRIKFTQSTVKYGIITAVGAFAGGVTPITFYSGTDYVITNAAISANYYSPVKVPLGFPQNPDNWSVIVRDTTLRSQASPVNDTWYNLGSISITIPIGIWRTFYEVTAGADTASTSQRLDTIATLSTANNSESDSQLSAGFAFNTSASAGLAIFYLHKEKVISLATATTYYLNTKRNQAGTVTNLYNFNSQGELKIKAICAYL